jgi:hypothetical protein
MNGNIMTQNNNNTTNFNVSNDTYAMSTNTTNNSSINDNIAINNKHDDNQSNIDINSVNVHNANRSHINKQYHARTPRYGIEQSNNNKYRNDIPKYGKEKSKSDNRTDTNDTIADNSKNKLTGLKKLRKAMNDAQKISD